MSRWQPESRARLEKAALELFAERGYDQTTVAEIAERAGLTERTFFRHYADKREVLFVGAGQLQDVMIEALLATPVGDPPLERVAAAVEATSEIFIGRRDFARQRQAIVVANTELRERELIKLATLAAAFADVLGEAGVPEPARSLAAEAGVSIFRVAFERWVADDNTEELAVLVRRSLDDLRAVAGG